ncbi:MAG: tetratricopeptide repeat protein [Gemmatimonas sp.]
MSNVPLHDALSAAYAAHEAGDTATAERTCRDVLGALPRQREALQLLGVILAQSGRLTEAERVLREAVETDPGAAFMHFNLGHVLSQQGRREEALASYTMATTHAPDFAPAAIHRCVVLIQLGRVPEAIDGLNAVLERETSADAFYHRGNALKRLGRADEALADYERALTLAPDDPEILYNRGNALLDLGRWSEAIASYDAALKSAPGYPDALNNRGIALQRQGRAAEAVASYDAALAAAPQFAAAHYNRGNALKDLHRYEEALASYDRALALEPGYAEAANNRGSALNSLRRTADAIAAFSRALELRPDYAEALFNRAQALLHHRDYAAAAADFERLRELERQDKAPRFEYLAGDLLHARMHCCDWREHPDLWAAVVAGVRGGERVCDPFAFLAISRSPADEQQCARLFAADRFPIIAGPAHARRSRDRIRLGYVSGEFCEQATAFLLVGVIEGHDKSRFEVVGFDNGIDDGSATRRRLTAAFDALIDISGMSDSDAAAAVRHAGIDILINLNGYFGFGRNGVFARRPAPIQINYLGFPGTLGSAAADYIIADRRVIPEGEYAFYDEKVVILPDSYQPNDSRRPIPNPTLTRRDAGLPERGFVFCSFNNTYKLTPEMFDRWMRMLRAVDGSVLWLLEGNPAVAPNLRREAEARGVDAGRIVFAPRLPPAQHFARQALADLFLDTLPYNAHTTASDALWAGLPVLTCPGSTFAGRVAASLLHALDLPELIADTPERYEEEGVRLACDPHALATVRAKLLANRRTRPLFDTDRYRRHLEAAYRMMWERHQRGEAPVSFSVAAIP